MSLVLLRSVVISNVAAETLSEQEYCGFECQVRCERIPSRALVAHERVFGVEQPHVVTNACIFECAMNLFSSLGGDVRISCSPNEEQFSLDFVGAFERLRGALFGAEISLVKTGRVETSTRARFGLECRAKREIGRCLAGQRGRTLQDAGSLLDPSALESQARFNGFIRYDVFRNKRTYADDSQITKSCPLPLGEGRVRISRFDETCDPHPALRATLSQRERDSIASHL